MDLPVPRLCARSLPIDTAIALASNLYGLEGELEEFRGEREQIFQISANGVPQSMLRVADHREDVNGIQLQNCALNHIEAKRLDIIAPRVLTSKNGRSLESAEHGGNRYCVRMLTYVPGVSVESIGSSDPLLSNVGVALAKLDQALMDFPIIPDPHPLVWRMEDATQLGRYLDLLPTPHQRDAVQRVLGDFESDSLPQFGNLRSQVIHNDFNPRNVLVDETVRDRVCGVIDFSDATRSALVVDLAVAAARHASSTNPLRSMARLVEGYERVLPLTNPERQVLFNLICVRLAMVMLIWSWRRNAYEVADADAAVNSAFTLMDYLLTVQMNSWNSVPQTLRS